MSIDNIAARQAVQTKHNKPDEKQFNSIHARAASSGLTMLQQCISLNS